MNGAGYGDDKKMAAARELARMFGSGGKSKNGGGGGGGRGDGRVGGRGGGSSSIPMKRQEPSQHHHQPRPAPAPPGNPHVPPPSLRNYTATLTSDPLKRTAGPILGKSSLDFLGRRDSTPKPSPKPAQAIQEAIKQVESPTVASTAASQSVASSVQGHSQKIAAEEKTRSSTLAVSKDLSIGSNVDLLRGLTTEPGQSSEKKPTNSIANIFFDMSEDSDEESTDDLEAAKAKEKAVNKSNAAAFLKYSSDDLYKLKPNAIKDILGPDCIVKRVNNTTGKARIATAVNKISGHLAHLQKEGASGSVAPSGSQQPEPEPDLLEIPTEAKLKAAVIQQTESENDVSQDLTRGKLESSESARNSGLRPQAPGFVPKPQVASLASPEAPTEPTQVIEPSAASLLSGGSVEQSNAQHAMGNNLAQVQSAYFAGQIVTVTPIQFADGCFIPGPSSGQLFMQPATATINQLPTLGVHTQAQPSTFSANLPIRNENNQAGSAAKMKKPIKGLGSSMWAK
ncbi:hypothetical protein FSARC_4708 [Fusarium sarcochroum]|uniref:Uncharacterized protein n=1 Tax=Fusarium sarcochroum TaxID=1208366 RepID=A0A8H4XB78_9HYPO|nr:hypothetical protein FSARC_4708 [Fusarium sarcochroum]